jgi:sensor histidine kinase YesM
MAPYFFIHNGILTTLPFNQDLVWSISASNLITALLASGMVLIMLLALLHRIFWPFLSRPIYAMTRYGIIKNQKILLTMSLMLLTWAIPAWKPFWTILGKV